jgi:hypothetical protein
MDNHQNPNNHKINQHMNFGKEVKFFEDTFTGWNGVVVSSYHLSSRGKVALFWGSSLAWQEGAPAPSSVTG